MPRADRQWRPSLRPDGLDAPANRRATLEPVAERVLSLQQVAGNAAVNRVLSRAGTRTLARAPDTVTLRVVPWRSMTAPEFNVFVDAQLLGLDEAEAAARRDELVSSDPHFTAGVTSAEAGKPIAVSVRLPALTETESADVEARRAELASLAESERRAIDAEADRRYWRKLGQTSQTKITDAGDRSLWERTRDEVIRDRNRLEALPADVRAVLMPHDLLPTPDRYADALRVGHKLQAFTWEDWALFQRRGGAPAGGLEAMEKAIDAFGRKRDEERRVVERIRGTEAIYTHVMKFNSARNMGMTPAQYKLYPDYQPMLQSLAAGGFKGVWDYDRATAQYAVLFQRRAVEIAMLGLSASEHVLNSEIDRYGDPRRLDAIFSDLAPVRAILDEYWADIAGSNSGTGQGANAPTRFIAEADEVRQRLVAKYPSLADPGIDTVRLGAATPAELGEVLRANAHSRLSNVRDTRERILDHPIAALHLDRVLALTRQELGADDGSVAWRIVKQDLADEANREAWKTEVLMWISIGFSMLTFGAGTPVVVGLAGSTVVSAYQTYDEWEKYQAALAAAHTSLDPTQSLSSEDPSLVWFAFALLGTAADAAFLGHELLAAKPAIQTLERTGDVVKFRAALAKASDLTPGLKTKLEAVAAAKADFKAAITKFFSAGAPVLSGGDPTPVLKLISELAFHAARIGIRKFDAFAEAFRAERAILRGFALEGLTPDELKGVKRAFSEGVREFDKTRPTIKVPFSKGTKTLSFGDEMLLDGKPVGDRVRDDVMKRLDLAHTDRGHGAFRDPRTLANEAMLNAAAPGGAGMAGQWASDEAMFENLAIAQGRVQAGRAVRAGGKFIVTFDASPGIGRVFAANSHLPLGATIRNAAPFAGLAVSEIAPNQVRAIFEFVDGRYKIGTIFPLFVP